RANFLEPPARSSAFIRPQSRNMQRPLAAFADIVIEMAIPRGQAPTRRRIFTGVGRYPGTLQSVHAERNPEGTHYIVRAGDPAPQTPVVATLQALLAASPIPLTRHELLARWPDVPPREDTLWRILARGCDQGLFAAHGAGTKTEPIRYSVRGA